MSASEKAAASAHVAASLTSDPIQSATVVRSWRANTPAGALRVELGESGWSVVLDGFSRSANQSLEVALGEATGTRRSEPWLQRLVAELEERRSRGTHA